MSALQVVVVSATNVPNAEKFGESDPYTSIEYKGKLNKLTSLGNLRVYIPGSTLMLFSSMQNII